MTAKSIRLSIGAIFPKGPGKIYFYRYQVDGHRKTVSLQTTNRAEALRKAEEFIPIIKERKNFIRGFFYMFRSLTEYQVSPKKWFRKYH